MGAITSIGVTETKLRFGFVSKLPNLPFPRIFDEPVLRKMTKGYDICSTYW